MQYKQYIPIIKALSDETRLKIVDMLSCGELCACKILEKFNITQPTLSYHMKILVSCGLVMSSRDGAWIHYSINEAKSSDLTQFLSTLVSEKQDCICND